MRGNLNCLLSRAGWSFSVFAHYPQDASREYSADEPDTCKDGTRNLYPSMWVGTFPTQMSNGKQSTHYGLDTS